MKDNLINISENLVLKELGETLANKETQKYMAEQIQQQMYDKISLFQYLTSNLKIL